MHIKLEGLGFVAYMLSFKLVTSHFTSSSEAYIVISYNYFVIGMSMFFVHRDGVLSITVTTFLWRAVIFGRVS
jgi:hypothetical protein